MTSRIGSERLPPSRGPGWQAWRQLHVQLLGFHARERQFRKYSVFNGSWIISMARRCRGFLEWLRNEISI